MRKILAHTFRKDIFFPLRNKLWPCLAQSLVYRAHMTQTTYRSAGHRYKLSSFCFSAKVTFFFKLAKMNFISYIHAYTHTFCTKVIRIYTHVQTSKMCSGKIIGKENERRRSF